MFKDPIVEEVCRAKYALAEKHGFDLRKRFQALQLKQASYAERVVTRTARPVSNKDAPQGKIRGNNS
jgi:hypothetical protein